MGLFKPDLYRFFAFGFAAGAVLVFTTLGGAPTEEIAQGVVPAAQAATAE